MNFTTSLYYDPTADINSFYAQQQSIAEAAAQRQAEILLQQYERSVAAQKEARAQQEAAALAGYNSLLDAAKARYGSALSQRQQSYDKAVGDVNGASERAMQQAYLSNELQKRNIGQQLAALGRSGGASETALLNMANNYGNARGTIDQNRTSQLGTLASQLASGRASDLDTYNSAKAGYDYDYQTKLANLANTAQEKLLGYGNTYASGLSQLEQSKEQQLAQLRSAHQDALMQTRQEQARLQAEAQAQAAAEAAAAAQATQTRTGRSMSSGGSGSSYNAASALPQVQITGGGQYDLDSALSKSRQPKTFDTIGITAPSVTTKYPNLTPSSKPLPFESGNYITSKGTGNVTKTDKSRGGSGGGSIGSVNSVNRLTVR